MEFLSSNVVKTRKSHSCWGCADSFPVGSVLTKINNVDGGKVHSSYWCEVCNAYWHELEYWEYDDGIDFGGFRNEEHYKKFANNYKNKKQLT